MIASRTAAPRRADSGPADVGAALIGRKDFTLAAKWCAAWVLALVLPTRAWGRVAEQAVTLAARLGSADLARCEADLARFLTGQPIGATVGALARRFAANPRIDQLAVMRHYTPRPWHPVLEVTGLEHIDAARAAGRGCLLWVAPTAFGPVIGKRGLAHAGLAVHHLSREGHGAVTRSRFGHKVLTLPRRHLEDRYLAGRIRIPNRGVTRGAMRRMLQLLRQGKIVSVTMGANADRTHRAPFLSSSMQVSLGVPELARQAHAALLPVLTIRTAPDRFRTIIEPPLDLEPTAERDSAGRNAVEEMARRLAPHALAWPDQISWDFDLFSGRPHHG